MALVTFGLPARGAKPWERAFNIIRWLHEKEAYKLTHAMDLALAKKQGYMFEYDMVDPSTVIAKELAPVAMSDKTRGLVMLLPRMRRIREFKLYEVHKHFGISLVDFLSMSREDVELIIAELQNDQEIVTALKNKQEQSAAEDARRALQKTPGQINLPSGRFPDQ